MTEYNTEMTSLSKRERQIMDVIYMLGEATAAEVLENLPEEVGEASIRKLIRIVEQKGYLKHRRSGHSYIYSPTIPKSVARNHALKHMLKTFFQGSTTRAVSALLDAAGDQLTENEIAEITARIREAEKREKSK
jgi:BlaI family penicillinase repressor